MSLIVQTLRQLSPKTNWNRKSGAAPKIASWPKVLLHSLNNWQNNIASCKCCRDSNEEAEDEAEARAQSLSSEEDIDDTNEVAEASSVSHNSEGIEGSGVHRSNDVLPCNCRHLENVPASC